MANILWLNWSGGGNLPPSLGVARELEARGHSVSFAGRPEMVPRVKTAGFRAIEFKRSYEQVDRYPQGSFLTRMSCYLTSPAVEEEVETVFAAERSDVAVIDAMFPAALAKADRIRRPNGRVCPYFRSPSARHVAGHDRSPRRHAPSGRLRRFAGSRFALGSARSHRIDEPRRIRRSAAPRLGEGASCRPRARG